MCQSNRLSVIVYYVPPIKATVLAQIVTKSSMDMWNSDEIEIFSK